MLLLTAAAALGAMAGAAQPPHIVSVMIDDLGSYDTQVENPKAEGTTLKSLADEGVKLDRFYSYMYCSPTRRSFMSGRFPVSINPLQADTCSNFMPLQFTLLNQKLGNHAGYISHFVGKGHLGYPTTDHLPVNRGYASHVGYLGGSEAYTQDQDQSHDFWFDLAPANQSILEQVWYSTNYYTTRAIEIVNGHDASTPLFLDLRYQGVHGPYVEPPAWEEVAYDTYNNRTCGTTYSCQILQSMVKVVDDGVSNLTTVLRKRGMWDNTLFVAFADNGGGAGGGEPTNNYPLRGTKAEPWEGGIRVTAFISGGVVPAGRRGTSVAAFVSVADWYPTLLHVAGLTDAQIQDNVMYNGSIRPIDGINAWPVLMGEADTLGREFFPVTNQSLIWNSTWKLITTAPSTHWFSTTDEHIADGWTCRAHGSGNHSTRNEWLCEVCSEASPCLFNIITDPQERQDVAKDHPDIVTMLQQRMVGLNFPPYTGEDLLPSEAAGYDCLSAGDAKKQWGRAGPCCIPKGSAWPPAPHHP